MPSSHTNTRSVVRGINAYLGANYGRTWANEKVAAEVCDYVAGMLEGPTELPESGLEPESGLKIAQLLWQAHDVLKAKGLTGEPDALRKTAANMTLGDLAVATVRFDLDLLAKQADALIMQGGQHTNRPGESPDSIAKLDQHNRPQGQYLVGVGNTDMKPAGHAILGKEEPHPQAPSNTAPTPNSLVEHSKNAGLMGGLGGTAPLGQALMERAKDVGGAISGAAQRAGGAISDVAGKGLDAAKALGSQMSPTGAAIGAGIGGLGAGGAAYAMSDEDTALRNALLAGGLGAAGGGLVGGLTPAALGAMGMAGGMGEAASQGMGKHTNTPKTPQLPGAGESNYPNVKPEFHMGEGKSASLADVLKIAQEINLSNDQTVALLNKLAAGGSLTGSKTNTPEDAAKHDQTAKLDQQNRSTNEYLVGVGNTKMPNKGQQLHVEHRSDQPGTKEKSPSTVPSKETKSAADEAFMVIFRKTAEEVGPHLPTHLEDEAKIAHVRKMMGMTAQERAEYLASLGK